ncbi:WhiB family transcriptional regulator [Planomonospora sp. ID67723]|nr:WhiB family transcriptional regulator [Planomonospora sp. ID67723]MBG0828580.1 WhiB family transcriptional regulator [Planomonospora sp. ID67723]
MRLALCAEVDPDLWFPEQGESNKDAKAICARCEVRTECLTYALELGDEFGVWGGLSGTERRPLTPAALAA